MNRFWLWRAAIASAALAPLACFAEAALAQQTQTPAAQPPATASPPAQPAPAVERELDALPVTISPPPPAPPRAQPMQPGAAAAQRNCDGYGEMGGAGDGMTRPGSLGIWRAAQDRRRRAPSFAHGVAYCTAALGLLDAQYPQYWMRRVSLLQSRAFHRLMGNDASGALADLDAAAQAAAEPQSAPYRRSLEFNTSLIRAYALVQNGDRAGGEALAMQTWAQRPYSREAGMAAAVVVGPEGARENIDKVLHAVGRLDPSLSEALYVYRFETGRYAEALELFSGLKAPIPIVDQSHDLRTSLHVEDSLRATAELFWLEQRGRKAFALAALGRNEEARAALAESRESLARATPAPAPLPPNASNRDRLHRVVQEQVNLEIQAKGPPIRDAWAALTEARVAAGEGRVADVTRALTPITRNIPMSRALVDIIDTLNAHAPPPPRRGARGARNAPASDARALSAPALPPAHLGLPPRDLKLLFNVLLDAETDARTTERAAGLFMSRESAERGGCTEQRDQTGDLVTLCFMGQETTPAVTEERALLRAARMTLERGKTHFLIEARKDYRRQLVTTMYGTPISQTEAGFESRLDIRFVDAEGARDCWRCIDAAEIQAALGPIYPAPAARQGRRR